MQSKISKMMKSIFIIFTLGVFSMNSHANDTSKNKRFPAEDYFSGNRLEMGQAIYKNDKEQVEKLLKQGIDINALSDKEDGFTYLMYSVFLDNRFEIAELLLKYKADPNKVSRDLSKNKKRYVYYLPLTFASERLPIKYMELLLRYGAKANYGYIDENGRMPLNAMYPINAAVRSSYILWEWEREDFMNDIKARVDLLLKYGADINSRGSLGKSVVEFSLSNPEIILYLMDKGADHKIYGQKILRGAKKLLKSNHNNMKLREIIRRLEALGYKE
ncbi:ankyrin repeat domain-containing protein [Pasteurella sp. PK-2025]|uniref:ankyrin repeat domain-containing protein n=1 Tax=Pasteurella sp. PK-2025 TaxID=3413133 RepID=UPI003C751219